MKKSIQTEGHKFNLDFINDHLIHRIKVRNLLTDSTFEARDVQLMRVKMDTIVAALEKRDPKSISFKLLEVSGGEVKHLTLKVEVHLDFLPSFDEVIEMGEIQVEKDKEEFFTEIEEITEMMNSLEDSKMNFHTELSSRNISQNLEVWRKELKKGKYHMQMSGILRAQNKQNQTLHFEIKVGRNQPIVLVFKTGTRSSYGYPYSVSHFLELDHDDQVQISLRSGSSFQNTLFENHHTVCVPAIRVN